MSDIKSDPIVYYRVALAEWKAAQADFDNACNRLRRAEQRKELAAERAIAAGRGDDLLWVL